MKPHCTHDLSLIHRSIRSVSFLVSLLRVSQLDGAYFGTTFAPLLIMMKPQLVRAPPKVTYVPRVFGFRIHAPLTAEEEVRSLQATAARVAGQRAVKTGGLGVDGGKGLWHLTLFVWTA